MYCFPFTYIEHDKSSCSGSRKRAAQKLIEEADNVPTFSQERQKETPVTDRYHETDIDSQVQNPYDIVDGICSRESADQ